MPWFKVDDQIVGNKKFARIPRAERMAATGLWTTLGSWCARELTGGHVERHMITEIGGTAKQARLLVAAGLWEELDNGYQFVHWDEYQPTREQVEADRAAAKERQRRARERARAAREARESQSSHVVTHGGVTPVVTVPPTRPDPTRPVLPTEVPTTRPSDVAASRRRAMTRGWRPSDETAAGIRAECPRLDIAAEHLVFEDYWIGTGRPMKDWEAVWRNWMRRAAKSTPPRSTGPTGNGNLANIARWADWADEDPTDQEAITR